VKRTITRCESHKITPNTIMNEIMNTSLDELHEIIVGRLKQQKPNRFRAEVETRNGTEVVAVSETTGKAMGIVGMIEINRFQVFERAVCETASSTDGY
jgi:hypothetical protein